MKILLAEDNMTFANGQAALLRFWGYDPVVVHDGDTALRALLAPDAPRLALLDWGMPGLDGVEVCRRVRASENGAYVYLILLTGRAGHDELLHGLQSGADEYLVKPTDPPELHARLNAGRRIATLQTQLLAAQEELRRQVTRDGLTGLANRTGIMEVLRREVGRSQRDGSPVGVVMADLDHFKRINDTHGHLVGDDVLQEAAHRLRTELRVYDAVGRYGGEEFLAVLPGCDADAAAGLAERLRQAIASRPAVCASGAMVPITLSLGSSSGCGSEVDARTLLREADAALYRAKTAGRNRVESARMAKSSCA